MFILTRTTKKSTDTSGKGKAVIDSEEIELTTGDWLKIAPAAKRQFFASKDLGIAYVCIQVKENSLDGLLPTTPFCIKFIT